jgi:hypothetical protein
MNRTRIVLRAVLAIAVAIPPLSLAPAPALAQSTRIRMPISFTLPAGQCPSLEVTIEGNGESFIVTNERIDENGVHHIIMNNFSAGTAVDSDDATYLFNYHQHAEMDVPSAGFPFQLTATDHFNLNGEGKANHLHVGFVASATFTSPSDPPTIEFVNMRGNPFSCDPI